ncbi:MAG TPA: glycosyltransferase family 39 protein, partial [Gemmatales bacterium]|nr:glycosyltransferase family 39 protein [Gemmatales bacterium]
MLAILLKLILLLQHPILARDGIHHIRFAYELGERSWNSVLREQTFHPGYSFTLLVASRIFEVISPGALNPDKWQWCAHLSSSLAGILLILPLYGVARCFYSVRTARLGCCFFLLLPAVVQITTDALTESWYLLFTLGSLWAIIHGVRSQRSSWFVLAGLLAGIAYLFRVEALIIPATYLVFLMLRGRSAGHWLLQGA